MLFVFERVESCDDGASARKLQSSCRLEQLAHTGCFPSHCVGVSLYTESYVDFVCMSKSSLSTINVATSKISGMSIRAPRMPKSFLEHILILMSSLLLCARALNG